MDQDHLMVLELMWLDSHANAFASTRMLSWGVWGREALFLDFWVTLHSGICMKTSHKKTKAVGSLCTEATIVAMQFAE
jgi:hypothetical protein